MSCSREGRRERGSGFPIGLKSARFESSESRDKAVIFPMSSFTRTERASGAGVDRGVIGIRESDFDDTMKDGELSLDHGDADIAINDICDYALYPQNIRALMRIIE